MDIPAEYFHQQPYAIQQSKTLLLANNSQPCQNIQQLANLLEQGKAKLINKEYTQAIIFFDKGIKQLADNYLSDEIIDDTGVKLTLANVEQKKGNLIRAANLKHKVLESRFTLLKDRAHCKETIYK